MFQKTLRNDKTVQKHMYRIEEKLQKLDRENLSIAAFFSCTRYFCRISEKAKNVPEKKEGESWPTLKGKQVYVKGDRKGGVDRELFLAPLKFLGYLKEQLDEEEGKLDLAQLIN